MNTVSATRLTMSSVVRRSSVRAHTLHELTELLLGVGFDAFTALDDGLEPFELGADRLWLIARKGER